MLALFTIGWNFIIKIFLSVSFGGWLCWLLYWWLVWVVFLSLAKGNSDELVDTSLILADALSLIHFGELVQILIFDK